MLCANRRVIKRARLLIERLERLSVDSCYAHQASGLRGAMIRVLAAYEETGMLQEPECKLKLIEQGNIIIIEAARQIPDSD